MGSNRESTWGEEKYFNNESFSKQGDKSFYKELHLGFAHF